MAKKLNYWTLRQFQKEQEDLLNNSIDELNLRIQKQYLHTADILTKEIENLYLKLQSKGNVTRNTVYQYMKKYNMYAELRDRLADLGGKQEDSMRAFLIDMYIDASNLTAKEIRAYGESSPFAQLNERAKDAVEQVWSADKVGWSKKIWKNQALLRDKLEEILFAGLASGTTAPKLAVELQQAFSVSYSAAKRLIVTEMAHIYNEGARDRMAEAGITHYKFLTARDEKVCEICAKYDGKIFPIDDKEHLPPLHPNDRCTIIAVFEQKENKK